MEPGASWGPVGGGSRFFSQTCDTERLQRHGPAVAPPGDDEHPPARVVDRALHGVARTARARVPARKRNQPEAARLRQAPRSEAPANVREPSCADRTRALEGKVKTTGHSRHRRAATGRSQEPAPVLEGDRRRTRARHRLRQPTNALPDDVCIAAQRPRIRSILHLVHLRPTRPGEKDDGSTCEPST